METSAPRGNFRTVDCNDLNNFICEIDENGIFSGTEGRHYFEYSIDREVEVEDPNNNIMYT